MAAGTGADDTGIEALEEIPTNEAAVEIKCMLQGCTDLTSVNGQAVCSSCCNSWKSQGKRTDGSNVLGGANPKNTVCRGRCGSC
eukprot:gene23708-9250_t